jgi:hypothetical protein
MQSRGNIDIQGIDVLVRPNTLIPVTPFEGDHLPFANGSFDCVLFVDVLHHTADQADWCAKRRVSQNLTW